MPLKGTVWELALPASVRGERGRVDVAVGLARHLSTQWVRLLLWLTGLSKARLRWRTAQYTARTTLASLLWFYCKQTAWLSWKAASLLLAPDVVLRQLLAVAALQALHEAYHWVGLGGRRLRRHSRRRQLLERQRKAASYQDWRRAARELDDIEGHTAWRADDSDTVYNAEGLRQRVTFYRDLQAAGDCEALMFHLRSSLLRKHFAATNPALYARSKVGTKRSVEEYVRVVLEGLQQVARPSSAAAPDDATTLAEKLAFFNETRHAFGRSALLLSGGAAMGLYHAGVIKTLLAHGLLPKVVAGASAGSILAGIVGTHTDEELAAAMGGGMDLHFFELADRSPPSSSRVGEVWSALVFTLPSFLGEWALRAQQALSLRKHWAQHGTLLDIKTLERNLRRNIGDYTFQEAYDRTGRIINITVSSAASSSAPMLLNYLTAPHVLIWSASLASCAIPSVFAPVELMARSSRGEEVAYFPEGLKWTDGSVECDLPAERLTELFNINQILVSQVNPHARIFGNTSLQSGPMADLISFLKQEVRAYISSSMRLFVRTPLKPLGIGLVPFVTQKYEGDITLVPNAQLPWKDSFLKLIRNPSDEEYQAVLLESERATWPLINRIQMQCAVEFALEEHVRALRRRLAGAPAQDPQRPAARLGSRVPSFYTSASMLNLSDLDVGAPGVPLSRAP